MAIDPTFFNNCHCLKILLFTSIVGQAGVSSGLFNIAMTQKLLNALKAHTGIEQLAGKRMAQTVQRIVFVCQPRFVQLLFKPGPASLVA